MRRRFVKLSAEFNPAEMESLNQEFNSRLKPAIQKWRQAYAERVPSEVDRISATNFVERLSANTNCYLYTFVVGDLTLTLQDSGGSAKVSYLMSRSGARLLNTPRPGGASPDISMPVQRDEVVRMAYSDSGRLFKPNEVHIKPTALGTALNGGAFVEITPEGADPYNGLSSLLDMVFGPDGKLINYERDPAF